LKDGKYLLIAHCDFESYIGATKRVDAGVYLMFTDLEGFALNIITSCAKDSQQWLNTNSARRVSKK